MCVNFLKLCFYFFIMINSNLVYGFDLCVVGSSGGLGRELIYQGINNNKKILALSNNPNNIKLPYRGGGLTSKNENLLLKSPNLEIINYNDFSNYNFYNVVFTSGAKPFEKDYSDIFTKNILNCEEDYADYIRRNYFKNPDIIDSISNIKNKKKLKSILSDLRNYGFCK